MSSLIEVIGERAVGTVEEVSANTICVLLDPNAPQATALNTGAPAGFPRINGYLLVPSEAGATVGLITKVKVDRLPNPKRRGMQESGLVDLPFPARMVSLTPLGTLLAKPEASGELSFEVRRGVDVFPSVGDQVLLPTKAQLRAIVEGESGRSAPRILIGTCPTAAAAPVYVDPDKLFGRHLAVLGNTGAGKSCSVAGLIRWSLDEARNARTRAGTGGEPSARFIVLDPNGEYAHAFQGLKVRLFQVDPQGGPGQPLKVPAWMWNGEEWAAFTGAAPGVQRPILFDAIRRLRSGAGTPDTFETHVRARCTRYHKRLQLAVHGAEHQGRGKREDVAQVLINLCQDFQALAEDCSDQRLKSQLANIAEQATNVENAARSNVGSSGKQWHRDFAESQLETVQGALAQAGSMVGLSNDECAVVVDTPCFFPVKELPGFVEALAADVTGRDLPQFVDSLNLRIRGLFAGGPLASVVDPGESASITLEQWLTHYLGADQASNGPIAVIDLSLVPSEVIHVVVAVLARMVFEAVQRYRRVHNSVLPTVLVLEEAHTFVHSDLMKDGVPSAGKACCRTFERIAREGRKFGLGLVLASQRPSEVSDTVLSQCNTFLLHRIVNDRDQDLVRRLVPDALGDLLRELPNLPSRRGVLLGWGAPAPVLIEVRELPERQRPQSPDPDLWSVWTGQRPCSVDWQPIADAWAGKGEVQAMPQTQSEAQDSPSRGSRGGEAPDGNKCDGTASMGDGSAKDQEPADRRNAP